LVTVVVAVSPITTVTGWFGTGVPVVVRNVPVTVIVSDVAVSAAAVSVVAAGAIRISVVV
jgi:hypothetical protein